jgi:hypothetical protein
MWVEALPELVLAEKEQEMVEALQEGFEEGLEWLSSRSRTSLAARATLWAVRHDIIQPLFRVRRPVGQGTCSGDVDAKIIPAAQRSKDLLSLLITNVFFIYLHRHQSRYPACTRGSQLLTATGKRRLLVLRTSANWKPMPCRLSRLEVLETDEADVSRDHGEGEGDWD